MKINSFKTDDDYTSAKENLLDALGSFGLLVAFGFAVVWVANILG